MKSRAGLSTAMITGWLFADLLLVLFLAVLGAVPAAAPVAGASPSPGASPGVSPRPTGQPCPQSFDLRYQRFPISNVSLSGLVRRDPATAQQLVSRVDQQIRARGMQDQYAGMILAFGLGPNSARATARSAALNAGQILKQSLPKFNGVVIREFNYETAQTNALYLDVYFLVRC